MKRALAALLVLVPAAVFAAPITVYFSGTAFEQIGIYAGQGTAVTGFITYDLALVDLSAASPTDNWFVPTTSGNEALPFEMSMTNGAITSTSADNTNAAGTNHYLIQEDITSTGTETLDFLTGVFSLADRRFIVTLLDTSTPLGYPALSTQPVDLASLDISLFDQVVGGVTTFKAGSDGQLVTDSELAFFITSFTRTPPTAVPEPGMLSLFGAGLVGLFFLRRRRAA